MGKPRGGILCAKAAKVCHRAGDEREPGLFKPGSGYTPGLDEAARYPNAWKRQPDVLPLLRGAFQLGGADSKAQGEKPESVSMTTV